MMVFCKELSKRPSERTNRNLHQSQWGKNST